MSAARDEDSTGPKEHASDIETGFDQDGDIDEALESVQPIGATADVDQGPVTPSSSAAQASSQPTSSGAFNYGAVGQPSQDDYSAPRWSLNNKQPSTPEGSVSTHDDAQSVQVNGRPPCAWPSRHIDDARTPPSPRPEEEHASTAPTEL